MEVISLTNLIHDLLIRVIAGTENSVIWMSYDITSQVHEWIDLRLLWRLLILCSVNHILDMMP